MILKEPIELEVTYQERIDKYISDHTHISRNDVKNIILDYGVFVDQDVEVRKPNFIVKPGHLITIKNKVPTREYNLEPQKMDLDIVYEDDDLVIINKPSGLVVHPAPGNYDQTLVNGLLYHFKDLSDLNGPVRPGIVHRIDKYTSGLILIAKNNTAHRYFAQLIKDHQVEREYKAIVKGIIKNSVTHINLPIGRNPNDRQKMMITKHNSKHATTHVYREYLYQNHSLVRCVLETGRTHQIRLHLSYINHPVVGDDLYGSYLDEFYQRLHAYKLSFKHLNGKQMSFEIDYPKGFFEGIEGVYQPDLNEPKA